MQNLKNEITFRYNLIQYKKMIKQFVLNRIEKNNVNLIYKAIEELNIQLKPKKENEF